MLRLFAVEGGAAVAGTGRRLQRREIKAGHRAPSRVVNRLRDAAGESGVPIGRRRALIGLVCAVLALAISASALAPGTQASPHSATDVPTTPAADAIALGRIDIGPAAREEREPVVEGQSAVRAAARILVLPDHAPTLWRGAPAVRARQSETPAWVLTLAARNQPRLPLQAALAQDAPVVAVAAAPLWSPHLSTKQGGLAAADAIAQGAYDVGSIDPSRLQKTPPNRAPSPTRRALDRPTSAATPRPAISIVLTAFGVSKSASEKALNDLPPEISVAIAPVAPSPFDWAEKARRSGRLTLIEAPMEPSSYPRINPGPMTLLTSLDESENAARLATVLSLANNVDGVATYLGDKFMRDGAALRPVLQAISDRGYFVFENNDDRRSELKEIAAEFGVPVRRPRVSLDKGGRVRDIRLALAELETAARTDGHAIGVAVAKPSTVEALQEWTRSLDRRGFRLQHLPR